MAEIVTTKPVIWIADSAWPRTTQPRIAPVTGAARPSRGGAGVGSRRIPLNHRMNASPVAARLR